jgi:hypothetical protein
MTQFKDFIKSADGATGAYISVLPHMGSELQKFIKAFSAIIPPAAETMYHCTLIYDKTFKNYNTLRDGVIGTKEFKAVPIGLKMYKGHDGDGYIVMEFDSEQLTKRHKFWRSNGCKHGFNDYLCHMTLAQKFSNYDKVEAELLPKLQAIPLPAYVVFNAEHVERIKIKKTIDNTK